MEQVENRLTCRSEGIYPRPELTWSTSPNIRAKTTEAATGLYDIISTVTLSERQQVYNCTVSTSSSSSTVTWFTDSESLPSDDSLRLHYITAVVFAVMFGVLFALASTALITLFILWKKGK